MVPIEQYKTKQLKRMKDMLSPFMICVEPAALELLSQTIEDMYSFLPKKRECRPDNLILRGYNYCIDEFDNNLKSKK
jgi:hypothetical protein